MHAKKKRVRTSFKYKNIVSTDRSLQLLYMDILDPSRTVSPDKNVYAIVIMDNYSCYTWTLFLYKKRDMFIVFRKLPRLYKTKNV